MRTVAWICAMGACLSVAPVPTPFFVDVTLVGRQSLSGFHLTEAFADREDGWNEHRAELWFAPGGFRLDTWTPGARSSTRGSALLPPGMRESLVLIRHPTRQFDECPVKGLAQAGDAYRVTSWPLGDDLSNMTARPVEEARTVQQWTTAAVELVRQARDQAAREGEPIPRRRARDDAPDAFGRVWFTDDVGIGLAEVRVALSEALRPYGPSLAMHSMWLLLVTGLDEERIDGLPPGVPVALELSRLGRLGATSEIASIERLALAPRLFEIPAGYARGDLCPRR